MLIAASKVIIDDECFINHVIEVTDDTLISHYPLKGEQPHTQWLRRINVQDGTVVEKEYW